MLYEHYVYGRNSGSSLTEFKRSNGFVRMDVPTYFVPLTKKGLIALKLGLHHGIQERIPEVVLGPLRKWRSRLYERQISR